MKRTIRKLLNRFLKKSEKKNIQSIIPNISGEDAEIIKLVQPYTMTSVERIYSLLQTVEYVTKNNIPGSFVECGVWKGGSVIALTKKLLSLNITDRNLYLFDTFEGMTKPGDIDKLPSGRMALEKFNKFSINESSSNWCNASLTEVKEAVLNIGYEKTMIHFIKGKVEDTIPKYAPERISILRLDTDWYESTKHELEHLFPRLSDKGILIIDDYSHWLGAKKATDEFISENNICLFLSRIDTAGCIAVKTN